MRAHPRAAGAPSITRTRMVLLLAFAVLLMPVIAACAQPSRSVSGAPEPSAPPTTASTPAASTPATSAPAGAGTWRWMAAAPVEPGWYQGVWTGTELILHAPMRWDEEYPTGTVDVAYDPATDTWRRLPSSPYDVMLVEGGDHAVWTGAEMLVFGLTNAAYNPSSDTWRPLPYGVFGPSVTVWTGRQVLMWGGGCCGGFTNAGAVFDLASNVWQPMPNAPLAPRSAPGVWTGTELIVVGGGGQSTAFADGAAYNPITRTWRTIASLPEPLIGASVTWTGTEMLVVGGAQPSNGWPTATTASQAYDPVTDRWRRLADLPQPRYDHTAAWTGSQLLVWGGRQPSTAGEAPVAPANGVAYDPAADRWAPMPPAPLFGRTSMVSVWDGDELLIWGGVRIAEPVAAMADGACFDPARG